MNLLSYIPHFKRYNSGSLLLKIFSLYFTAGNFSRKNASIADLTSFLIDKTYICKRKNPKCKKL